MNINEPWKLIEHNPSRTETRSYSIENEKGEVIADDHDTMPISPTLREAQRIVACVNALAGLNPAALAELLKHADDLLELATDFCEDIEADGGGAHNARITCNEFKAALNALRTSK